MKRILNVILKYKFALILILLDLCLLQFRPGLGVTSLTLTWEYVLEMLSVIPPIFIIMGLVDAWIPKELMMKYMGKGAGPKGGLLAFLLGAFSSGPLYAAFPIASMLIKKGASLVNVFLFLGAWSTTKIPMMLFEATQLGSQFAAIRFVLNTIGIIVLAFIIEKSTSQQREEELYQRISKISQK